MSHPEQLGFFGACANGNSALIRGASIIEIGAFDVNGSIRKIFDQSDEYVGVDLDHGPGVDLVAYGHEVVYPDGHFDVAISGECFEHDPHWRATFVNMSRMTRPGGLVAFTCASKGRPEHGTRRTDTFESPGTQAVGLDYYHNLTAREVESQVPLADLFVEYRFWYLPTSFDLYFAGVRGGTPVEGSATAQLPDPGAVAALVSIMSWPHRLARFPLHVILRLVPEQRFQAVALPYWRTLLRLQDKISGGRFRRAEHL